MIKFYHVLPISVVFFRDPRPFTAGEQNLARLMFPPHLTPFLGALRTKFLEDRAKIEGKEIHEIFDKYGQHLKSISIIWFSMIKNDKAILPLPLDTFTWWQTLTKDRFVFENLEDVNQTEIEQSIKVPIMIREAYKNSYRLACNYITIEGFYQYLKGYAPSENELIQRSELWQFENRIGIALDPESKTTERSKFYRLKVARPMQGVGFLVGIEFGEDIDLPETFTTRLGGEGHIAVWKEVDIIGRPTERPIYFRKLVALTHIPIKKSGDPNFELQNWCINKLDIISGWDYKENRPKPLLNTLKPGAVLTVKTLKNTSSCKTYSLRFGSIQLTVVKDLVITVNNHKLYLTESTPNLGEPNTLFIIKN